MQIISLLKTAVARLRRTEGRRAGWKMTPRLRNFGVLAGCVAAAALSLRAQGRGSGGSPGGGGAPGGTVTQGGRIPGATGGDLALSTANPGNNGGNLVGSGLQLGPPGRWWNDEHFVREVRLRPEQKQRLNAIFEENKGNLLSRYQALKQEESKMDRVARGKVLEESVVFAQIDRVTQARGELEKATAHYLLQIRKAMDADQIERLGAGW